MSTGTTSSPSNNHELHLEPISFMDVVWTLLAITIIGVLAMIFAELDPRVFGGIPLSKTAHHLAIPALGAFLILIGMLLVRSLDKRAAELAGIGVAGLGILIAWNGIVAIPTALNVPPKNPTVEVQRGGADFEEITVKGMELPAAGYDKVTIFTQAMQDIPAEKLSVDTVTGNLLLECVIDGATQKLPLKILVPKGSHGEVYYKVNGKDSLASSY